MFDDFHFYESPWIGDSQQSPCLICRVAAAGPLQDAGCYCEKGVHFGARMLVPLKTAAAGCHWRLLLLQGAAWVLLSEWCVRFGAACWCRCRVPLKVPVPGAAAAVRLACALWSWYAGATAGCRCLRVLLSELHVHFGVGMLQGAAAGRGVRFEAGMPVPLQGAAAGCCQNEICFLRALLSECFVKGLSAS